MVVHLSIVVFFNTSEKIRKKYKLKLTETNTKSIILHPIDNTFQKEPDMMLQTKTKNLQNFQPNTVNQQKVRCNQCFQPTYYFFDSVSKKWIWQCNYCKLFGCIPQFNYQKKRNSLATSGASVTSLKKSVSVLSKNDSISTIRSNPQITAAYDTLNSTLTRIKYPSTQHKNISEKILYPSTHQNLSQNDKIDRKLERILSEGMAKRHSLPNRMQKSNSVAYKVNKKSEFYQHSTLKKRQFQAEQLSNTLSRVLPSFNKHNYVQKYKKLEQKTSHSPETLSTSISVESSINKFYANKLKADGVGLDNETAFTSPRISASNSKSKNLVEFSDSTSGSYHLSRSTSKNSTSPKSKLADPSHEKLTLGLDSASHPIPPQSMENSQKSSYSSMQTRNLIEIEISHATSIKSSSLINSASPVKSSPRSKDEMEDDEAFAQDIAVKLKVNSYSDIATTCHLQDLTDEKKVSSQQDIAELTAAAVVVSKKTLEIPTFTLRKPSGESLAESEQGDELPRSRNMTVASINPDVTLVQPEVIEEAPVEVEKIPDAGCFPKNSMPAAPQTLICIPDNISRIRSNSGYAGSVRTQDHLNLSMGSSLRSKSNSQWSG